MRANLINGPSSFESLSDQWGALTRHSPAATPFQTLEWQRTWFKHYGAGKRLQTLALYEGSDLVGLAPFVLCPGPWRTLRWAGGGPSDYMHPIAAAGHEESVTDSVVEFLTTPGKFDLIDLHQVRETQPLAQRLLARPACSNLPAQATCLVLDLPKTFDDYLKTLGKSLRYDVKKLDKDLFLKGEASMETARADQVGPAFEIFLDQHRARWRDRKLPGAFVGRSLRFHREWVHAAADRGWLRLKILRHHGEPAGAIYAMQFSEVLYYYQAGFDPAHKSISPGTLLVADSIRTGIEEGASHFDFMRGDEPYKRRWKPQNSYSNQRLLMSGGGGLGRLGQRWNETANRLEIKVRAKLEG